MLKTAMLTLLLLSPTAVWAADKTAMPKSVVSAKKGPIKALSSCKCNATGGSCVEVHYCTGIGGPNACSAPC
jgi:hypothetical protein